MLQHWDEAEFVLETLVDFASCLDSNGLELFFTCGGEEIVEERDGSKLVQAMWKKENMPRKVQTDIRVALSRVFGRHLRQLDRHHDPTRLPKTLLLLVLTDGAWEGMTNKTDVDLKIVEFVRQVRDSLKLGSIPEHPVAIQFIQFGKDPEAVDRLQKLDDDLTWEHTIELAP